jgi:hypothetical protein
VPGDDRSRLRFGGALPGFGSSRPGRRHQLLGLVACRVPEGHTTPHLAQTTKLVLVESPMAIRQSQDSGLPTNIRRWGTRSISGVRFVSASCGKAERGQKSTLGNRSLSGFSRWGGDAVGGLIPPHSAKCGPNVAPPPSQAAWRTGRKSQNPRGWREDWDSNPGAGCPANGFQDRRLRPLGHPPGLMLPGRNPRTSVTGPRAQPSSHVEPRKLGTCRSRAFVTTRSTFSQ